MTEIQNLSTCCSILALSSSGSFFIASLALVIPEMSEKRKHGYTCSLKHKSFFKAKVTLVSFSYLGTRRFQLWSTLDDLELQVGSHSQ